VTVEVINETSSEENATISLQVGNIASNLTINYGPCSEPSLSYTTVPLMIPAIELVNLTANTTYCYSINVTDTASDATVGSCYGTFTTATEATTSPATLPIQPSYTVETPINITAIVLGTIAGTIAGVVALLVISIFIIKGVVVGYLQWRRKCCEVKYNIDKNK